MRRLGRNLLWLAAGIALLLLLFHGVENWRGKRSWARWKQSREALGDSYDWNAFVPPPVPDADNFAMAPCVAKAVRVQGSENLLGAFDIPEDPATAGTWREGKHADLAAWALGLKGQDLESILRPIQTELEALALASRRPRCRFPAHYERAELPELMGFKRAGRALRLRALLRLSQGRTSEAREDVLTILSIARHLNSEPSLLGFMLQMAMVELALQPAWEGLTDRVWREQDLVQLQAAIEQVDVLRALSRAWRQERLSVSDFSGTTLGEFAVAGGWERARGLAKLLGGGDTPKPSALRVFALWCLIPRGWVYQNMIQQDRIWAEGCEPCLDVARHQVFTDRAERIRKELKTFEDTGRKSPHRFLAARSIPRLDLHAFHLRAGSLQAGLDQAAIACALERHWRLRGAYPERLEALRSDAMPNRPCDVIGGAPLRYVKQENGTYLLYSVGADGVDDGGVVVLRRELPVRQDLAKGDWCWSKVSDSESFAAKKKK